MLETRTDTCKERDGEPSGRPRGNELASTRGAVALDTDARDAGRKVKMKEGRGTCGGG